MFCNKCGNKMDGGAAFCGKCGNKAEPNGPPEQGYNKNVATEYSNEQQPAIKKMSAVIIGIVAVLLTAVAIGGFFSWQTIIDQKAEQARIAAEEARLVEQAKLAEEQAKLAEEQANRAEEEARLAEEEAMLAETERARLAEEQARRARLAEQARQVRLAEERARRRDPHYHPDPYWRRY